MCIVDANLGGVHLYFPFFIPPPLNPLPFILEPPALDNKERLFFLLKLLSVFFWGGMTAGFFGATGFSFGVDSFFSSDIVLCLVTLNMAANLKKIENKTTWMDGL